MAKWKQWYKQMGWSETLFTFRHDELTHLQEFIEEKIRSSKADLAKQIEDELANVEEQEDRDAICEMYEDEYKEYDERFPLASRYAMTILSYSLLENTLVAFCHVIDRDSTTTIRYKKFTKNNTGSILEIAWLYLSSVGGSKLRSTSRRWKKLNRYYRIVRNAIVHDGGKVKKTKVDEVKEILKRIGHSRLSQHNEIVLEEAFVNTFLTTIDDFVVLEMFDKSPRRHKPI